MAGRLKGRNSGSFQLLARPFFEVPWRTSSIYGTGVYITGINHCQPTIGKPTQLCPFTLSYVLSNPVNA